MYKYYIDLLSLLLHTTYMTIEIHRNPFDKIHTDFNQLRSSSPLPYIVYLKC